MVGWDISQRYATFTEAEAEELSSISELGRFCVMIQRCLSDFGISNPNMVGLDLPDPMAMAVALDPAVATVSKPLHVGIERSGELTRGATVVDHLGISGKEPNAEVVLEASRERFVRLLHNAVRA